MRLNFGRARERLVAAAVDAQAAEQITAGIDALAAALDAEPKSRRWRLRARMGERVRWYDEPDEIAEP